MLKIEDLEGKWFINNSNFPMWLKGDKTSPTFNYTIENKGKIVLLLDKVTYMKKGKPATITGFDTPVNNDLTEFIWRGKGILKLLKSRWRILFIDTKHQWAIIHFDKTLFTPEGYDVISRNKTLKPATEMDIKKKLNELGVTLQLSKILQE
jgi:hypothetical protein